jgi:2-methylisocitrate lyase-like PEP mutase family enzyme
MIAALVFERCTSVSSSSSCRTRGTWAPRSCLPPGDSRRLRPRAPGSPGRSASSTSRSPATHVSAVASATPLPLNVDSERCDPGDPGGITETVSLLADAGAAGFSIEDYDPGADRIEDLALAVERVEEAARAAHDRADPLVLTGRCENHIRSVDDLDDTIERLVAYRDAGADVVYAPGLRDLDRIVAVVGAVGVPVNVLALPGGPTVAELESVGVRRVSTGGALAAAAYGALWAGASELGSAGTSDYASGAVPRDALDEAFG